MTKISLYSETGIHLFSAGTTSWVADGFLCDSGVRLAHGAAEISRREQPYFENRMAATSRASRVAGAHCSGQSSFHAEHQYGNRRGGPYHNRNYTSSFSRDKNFNSDVSSTNLKSQAQGMIIDVSSRFLQCAALEH